MQALVAGSRSKQDTDWEISARQGRWRRSRKRRANAYESERSLKAEIEACDLAFITAGLGGGTGTGSAHVVARLAPVLGGLDDCSG